MSIDSQLANCGMRLTWGREGNGTKTLADSHLDTDNVNH